MMATLSFRFGNNCQFDPAIRRQEFLRGRADVRWAASDHEPRVPATEGTVA